MTKIENSEAKNKTGTAGEARTRQSDDDDKTWRHTPQVYAIAPWRITLAVCTYSDLVSLQSFLPTTQHCRVERRRARSSWPPTRGIGDARRWRGQAAPPGGSGARRLAQVAVARRACTWPRRGAPFLGAAGRSRLGRHCSTRRARPSRLPAPAPL